MGKLKNYHSSSKNWIVLGKGQKKIKLRQYVNDLSKRVLSYKIDTKNFSEIRQTFIEAYNKAGLDGLNSLYISCVEACKAKLEKELEEINNKKQNKDENKNSKTN